MPVIELSVLVQINVVAGCYVLLAIGKVTNVVLKHHILQWDPSEVRSEDSSLVVYNVTITNSSMLPVVIGTTENTSLSINSSLFMPCKTYSISVLPYQLAASRIEEGIPLHIFKEYPDGKYNSYSLLLCYIQLILAQMAMCKLFDLSHIFASATCCQLH